MPPSAGWTRLTRGVSFLKTFKRKTKARVCGLDLEQPRDREPLFSSGSVGAVELGCPGGGPRAVVRASLLYRLLDLFSKPVFHFIRFGHLQIQNSMPTSTLCAFLVPRSSDPPGRSRSQGCARPCGRGPGGGARGGLAREGHGWGPESGVRLWHVNACWPGMEQRAPRKSLLALLRSEVGVCPL